MVRKEQLYQLLDNKLLSSVVRLLHQLDSDNDDLLRVLTYHRVDELNNRPHLNPSLLSATPEHFRQQMELVSKHFNPVSIHEVLDAFQNQKSLKPKSVLVTFDDAYCDFEEHVLPVIQEYQIPVTLFVPTSFPDSPESLLWWDQTYHAIMNTKLISLDTAIGNLSFNDSQGRIQAFKQVREYVKQISHTEAMAWVQKFCKELEVEPKAHNSILGWDALRKVAASGVTLAPHTHTHPMIDQISAEEVRHEVQQSWDILRQEIGDNILPIFAYPSGQVNQVAVETLKDMGIQLAFTTERGINNIQEDNPLLLKRINVSWRIPNSIIDAQLLSWFDAISKFA